MIWSLCQANFCVARFVGSPASEQSAHYAADQSTLEVMRTTAATTAGRMISSPVFACAAETFSVSSVLRNPALGSPRAPSPATVIQITCSKERVDWLHRVAPNDAVVAETSEAIESAHQMSWNVEVRFAPDRTRSRGRALPGQPGVLRLRLEDRGVKHSNLKTEPPMSERPISPLRQRNCPVLAG
jgi:hypothetical protein